MILKPLFPRLMWILLIISLLFLINYAKDGNPLASIALAGVCVTGLWLGMHYDNKDNY